jgi:hypothetical protein
MNASAARINRAKLLPGLVKRLLFVAILTGERFGSIDISAKHNYHVGDHEEHTESGGLN